MTTSAARRSASRTGRSVGVSRPSATSTKESTSSAVAPREAECAMSAWTKSSKTSSCSVRQMLLSSRPRQTSGPLCTRVGADGCAGMAAYVLSPAASVVVATASGGSDAGCRAGEGGAGDGVRSSPCSSGHATAPTPGGGALASALVWLWRAPTSLSYRRQTTPSTGRSKWKTVWSRRASVE
eukprot:4398253-Pleurochrysis_carterae.AAC.3